MPIVCRVSLFKIPSRALLPPVALFLVAIMETRERIPFARCIVFVIRNHFTCSPTQWRKFRLIFWHWGFQSYAQMAAICWDHDSPCQINKLEYSNSSNPALVGTDPVQRGVRSALISLLSSSNHKYIYIIFNIGSIQNKLFHKQTIPCHFSAS